MHHHGGSHGQHHHRHIAGDGPIEKSEEASGKKGDKDEEKPPRPARSLGSQDGNEGGGGSEKEKDKKKQQTRIVRTAPKTIPEGCSGSCGTIKIGMHDFDEVVQAFHDLADYMVSPMIAGPFLQSPALTSYSPEAIARVDRLWELRLCIEMLRDTFDSYDDAGDSIAETEMLEAVDEALRRIAELSFKQSLEAESDPLLQAVNTKDFQRERFTRCLLGSGLRISGLLEAVLGELTDWQSKPTEAESRVWQRWDRLYERVAKQSASKESVRRSREMTRDQLATVSCNEVAEAECPTCPAPRLVEGFDSKSLRCGPLFGMYPLQDEKEG